MAPQKDKLESLPDLQAALKKLDTEPVEFENGQSEREREDRASENHFDSLYNNLNHDN